MQINKHERMFEELCFKQKIIFKRILESRTRTPDYILYDDGDKPVAIIEIKALQKTDLDRGIEKRLESIFALEMESDRVDDSEAFAKARRHHTSILRIREYIRQANDQFRCFEQLNIPGILVLYSERISTCFEISENLLDRATDGDCCLLVDQSLGGIIDRKIKGKTLRPNKNQLVSAVIAPQESGEIIVRVNDCSKTAFPRGLFKSIKII